MGVRVPRRLSDRDPKGGDHRHAMRIVNETDEIILLEPGESVDVRADTVHKKSGRIMILIVEGVI